MNKSLIILFTVISSALIGQSFVFPTDFFFDSRNQTKIALDSNSQQFHNNILPIINGQVIYSQQNSALFVPNKKIVGRKILNEDLIEIKHTDFETGYPRKTYIAISPLLNFQGGLDLSKINSLHPYNTTEKIYTNTRGLLLKSSVGAKIFLESIFLENQSSLLEYQDTFALKNNIIPGSGRWKKFKLNGYDYAMASGYFLFKVNKNFLFQAGHGKHKIGSGYRSLLLSDNSFTYPYIRLTQNWWKGKIQYTNIYAVLMNLNAGGTTTPFGTERLFQKKAASFQHVSVNFNKYINISLFQSLIWEKPDSTNKQKISAEYFNPLIFSNIALYRLNTSKKKNCMAGFELVVRPLKNLNVYFQLAIDEIGRVTSLANKTGFETGIKYYNAFTLKNLYLQIEYNQVRPYTYSSSDSSLSYSHYNQALAHPLGANFKETVAILSYSYKRIFLQTKVNLIQQGLNSAAAKSGANILQSAFFAPPNGNTQNQGLSSNTKIVDLKIGFLFNPKTNLNISLGCLVRTQNTAGNLNQLNTNYIYIALKTSMFNQYLDF